MNYSIEITDLDYRRGVVAYSHELRPCDVCLTPTRMIWRSYFHEQYGYVVRCSDMCAGAAVTKPLVQKVKPAVVDAALAELML